MQQHIGQQAQQASVCHDDRHLFIEEISTQRFLAKMTGTPPNIIEELEALKQEVERLDSAAWEQKDVRALKRNELVRLSLATLRAFYSRSR